MPSTSAVIRSPFLAVDGVIIDVLVVGHAVDGRLHRDRLRLGEVVVRLDLGHVLQGADAERPELADAGRGADPEVVEAERGVGGDLEGRLDLAVVDGLELRDGDPRLIEEDFLGVGQPLAGEVDLDLGPALAAERPDVVEDRARGAGARRG